MIDYDIIINMTEKNKEIKILLAEYNPDIYGTVRDAIAEIGADLVIIASSEEA